MLLINTVEWNNFMSNFPNSASDPLELPGFDPITVFILQNYYFFPPTQTARSHICREMSSQHITQGIKRGDWEV